MKLKPFDLEAAKRGEPVVTRHGRPVRILCFDRPNQFYPIVCMVNTGAFDVFNCTTDGRLWDDDTERDYDLFMAPKKREGWVNVYRVFDTEEMAKLLASPRVLVTKKIEWEE